MSTTDNRWEFKAIAEKMLTFEGISDYQRGYCHGQIDAADAMSEDLEKQNQIAKAAPEMLEALEEVVAIQEKHRTSARLTHICMIVLAEHARAIIAKAKGEQQ